MQVLTEGQYMNGFLNYRFNKNKNAIIVVSGSTGSGKTYACLRIAEKWYEFKWKEKFPIEHVCFSVNEVVNLLKSGKMRKGDLIILEEAGANLGSLDFQSKVSKLFTYILQSFRSMNVGLIMNLPVLTMLNKQTRQLLHMHMITKGIDFSTKTSLLDAKVHQLNQHSGKSYWKHPVVTYNHRRIKLKLISYGMPSQDIVNVYEVKKTNFVGLLVSEYEDKTTKTPAQIRKEEDLKNDEARLQARNAFIDKKRDEKGVLRCIKCKKSSMDVTSDKITCRRCGHIEILRY